MTNPYTSILASTYGSGAYDSSNYDGVTAGTTTTTTSSGGNAGGSSAGGTGVLTDTGIAIAFVVMLASVILLTALVIRVWKRPAAETVPIDEQ